MRQMSDACWHGGGPAGRARPLRHCASGTGTWRRESTLEVSNADVNFLGDEQPATCGTCSSDLVAGATRGAHHCGRTVAATQPPAAGCRGGSRACLPVMPHVNSACAASAYPSCASAATSTNKMVTAAVAPAYRPYRHIAGGHATQRQ